MINPIPSNFFRTFRTAIILGSLGIGFLGFALPVYGKKLGLSAVEIGGLFSLYSIGTLLIRPGIGWAMDRYGRKWFLFISLLLFAVSMLIFAVSAGVVGLYSARILQAIGGAVFWIAAYTIVTDLSDGSDKAKKIGIVDESFARGTFIGSAIGFTLLGFFHADSTWNMVFILYAVLGLFGTWLVFMRVPETNPGVKAEKNSKSVFFIERHLIKTVCIILVNTIAISTASMMAGPIPMLLLQDYYTKDILALGAVYVPFSIIMSTLPSRVGKLSDKIGRTIPICGGLLIAGIATVLVSMANNYYMLVFLWGVETIGISLMSPAQAVLLTDKTGNERSTGSTYGLFTFVTSIARIIGPIWGSWLYGQYGVQAFQFSGYIILGAAAIAFLGLKGEKVKIADKIKAPAS